MSRLPGFSRTLDRRTVLLVSQLAAESSGCRWCIERGRHDWRAAGLPQDLLPALAIHPTSPLFTMRERAALAFVEAVAQARRCAGEVDEVVLHGVRQVFTEFELVELTAIIAGYHCLDSLVNLNCSGS